MHVLIYYLHSFIFLQTMEVGSVAKWYLKEGDFFKVGTAICDVETDKATVTYEVSINFLLMILIFNKSTNQCMNTRLSCHTPSLAFSPGAGD